MRTSLLVCQREIFEFDEVERKPSFDLCAEKNPHSCKGRLHGEFQPGLKFRSAHRAEILLRLHDQFQPMRKTLIPVGKFNEMRKHNRYACSRSFFSPG